MKYSLTQKAFKTAFFLSKSLRVGDLFFRYYLNREPQLGIIASRKYGNAFYRNLFKRRCRAIFNKLFVQDLNYVIIVQPRRKKVRYKEIYSAFEILKTKIS